MTAPAEDRIHVVTVNSDTTQSTEVIEKVKQNVAKTYHLVHVANCASINVVKHVLTSLITQPKVLICSSKWYEEEQEEIREISKRILPEIKLVMLPSNLKGGDEETVAYLEDQISSSRLPTRA